MKFLADENFDNTIEIAIVIPGSNHDIHQPQNRLRLQKNLWFPR